MDPHACLDAAAAAAFDEDYETLIDHLNAYREWREAGGFEPPTVKHPHIAPRGTTGDAMAFDLRELYRTRPQPPFADRTPADDYPEAD